MEARDGLPFAGRQVGTAIQARIQLEGAADHVIPAEVLAGHLACQHHAVRGRHGGVRIAAQYRQAHHLEEIRIDPGDRFVGGRLADPDLGVAHIQPRDVFYFREVQLQEVRGGRGGDIDMPGLLARQQQLQLQPVDALMVGHEAIEADLVAQVEPDQDRRSEADAEPQDGDAGIEPVARQVAKGGGEVVAEHDPLP